MGVHDQRRRGTIVFLTVCTAHRQRILLNAATVPLLRSAWQKADSWMVGRWVVMPDHLHLFCSPALISSPAIRPWVSYWKSLVSRAWEPKPAGGLWQTDGWDTQLRRGQHYSLKWDYVRMNPVRAGLCERPEDWPYQGEENVFTWID